MREQAPPAVIGVDLLSDSTQYAEERENIPQNDPPIVWASGISQEIIDPVSFPAWFVGIPDHHVVKPSGALGFGSESLLAKPGALNWGIPIMPRDADFRVRRLLRKVVVSANPESSAPAYERPTWVSAVVQTYCQTPSSGCSKIESKSEA